MSLSSWLLRAVEPQDSRHPRTWKSQANPACSGSILHPRKQSRSRSRKTSVHRSNKPLERLRRPTSVILHIRERTRLRLRCHRLPVLRTILSMKGVSPFTRTHYRLRLFEPRRVKSSPPQDGSHDLLVNTINTINTTNAITNISDSSNNNEAEDNAEKAGSVVITILLPSATSSEVFSRPSPLTRAGLMSLTLLGLPQHRRTIGYQSGPGGSYSSRT